MTTIGRAQLWRPGDDPGHRQFQRVFDSEFTLEAGGSLPYVDMAFETWGELNADGSNAVLVLHAISGDSHLIGEKGPGHPSDGWWGDVAGPKSPIDTNRYFVVCPNVLGGCQGTTGPGSIAPDGRPFGSRFPIITIRDQVAAEQALAQTLGIRRWSAVVGGSMGGMRALEWCALDGDLVDRAVVVAVGGVATAEQIGLCDLQIRTIQADPGFHGGDYYETGDRPTSGLAIARGFGQISYRTASELETRFANRPQDDEDPFDGGRYAVSSYLRYHGDRLVSRFDPNSYIVLSRAMNHHDVGRGRGGLAAALDRFSAEVTVAGIDSDRLYPIGLQEDLSRLLHAGPTNVIHSLVGHDGFLVETDAVGQIVREALA